MSIDDSSIVETELSRVV